jgi:hypothetical protein
MPNTTNFNFPTPADTDLVKDGALAIRNLGNSIDTAFVDLKGGTSGQVLSKNSNTDLDFTWVAQDDSNAIQNAIVDAKGDLISATAADTPARLAVGTNGQVLTADSAEATGLKWATASSGGMTLISETTASGLSSLSLSSIPSTYKNLVLTWQGVYISDSTTEFGIRFNNDSTSGIYKGIGARPTSGGSIYTINSPDSTNATNIAAFPIGMNTTTSLNAGNGNGTLTIYNYASTSKLKQYQYNFSYNRASSGENIYWVVNGTFATTTAISSIDIFRITGSGTFSNNTDTTFRLHGVA